MKNTFIWIILAIGFVSCQMTERFYLQESGEVRYEYEINFSEMMGFVYDETTRDSLRMIGEFPIDTLINFADVDQFSQMASDTVSAAEKEFMKSMDKTKVRMVMNENEGKMVVGIDEKNVESFNSYLTKMSKAIAKLEKEDPLAAQELSQSGMLNPMEIKYDGKNFQRIAKKQNLPLEELDDSLQMATQQMMGMFEYKMEYHFPKRISKTNSENATFSLDGKVMTVVVPMSEYIENPEKYNFTVEFE